MRPIHPRARPITRRDLLRGAVAGLGGALLSPLVMPRHVRADPPGLKRLVAVEMNGAWDMLLSTDPRDPQRSYAGIALGTDQLDARYQTPRATRIGRTSAFARDALMGSTTTALAPHDDVLTLIRGLNMNTVSHPTGRAYMATGIAPAGATPRGSSLGTALADRWNRSDAPPILPHVAIGSIAFNRDYPDAASALSLARASEVRDLLSQRRVRRIPEEAVQNDLDRLIAAARASHAMPDAPSHDAETGETQPSLVSAMSEARTRLDRIDTEGLATRFDFSTRTDLQTLYGPDVMRQAPSAALAAATAARLVTAASESDPALASAVEVVLGTQLDTHRDWATDHPAALQPAFDALGAMLTDLRASDPNLEHTLVIVHSEFGRNPMLNGSDGRDHHFASSMMLYGGGLVGGVFGATGEEDLGLVAIDRATGMQHEGGIVLTPEDVFATIASALGVDVTPYRAEPLPLVRT
jgi:uncharacterized protein (DUF1501 family)